MHRIALGLVVLLLAIPAVHAQDKPGNQDQPVTPAEQYQALLKEYQQALKAYQDASRNAKTPEEQRKVFEEQYPKRDKLAPKFVELAEKHPKDPVAIDALIWVLGDTSGAEGGQVSRARALELLVRDHIQNEKIGRACSSLGFSVDHQTETFLRAVMAKSPHKDVQAEACLALAQTLNQRADIAQVIRDNPEIAKQAEKFLGKGVLEEMNKTDMAKLELDSAKVFKELADKHVGALKPERLINLCERLGSRATLGSRGQAGEAFLRTLLEKDSRHDVQGVACLSLGQSLRKRADELAASDGKEAAKLQAEAEKILERAAEQFGDVKSLRGTIANRAKTELFDLRHLAVGKPAPEVEGEDQDGKKFKLSDYKGKVVLLDFWSQY
jgi:hypothetical protein